MTLNVTIGLDHVAISADNTEQMVQWYNRMLGMVVLAQTEPVESSDQRTYIIGPANCRNVSGGMMLEIMPRNDHVRRPRESHDPGISHIAWMVENFDDAYTHLAAQGVGFVGSVVQAVGGGRLISFVDCEGNLTQIVERKPNAVT